MNRENSEGVNRVGAEQQTPENKAEIESETGKTGELLNCIFNEIDQYASNDEREAIEKAVRLLFRAKNKSQSVWVEKTEYDRKERTDGDVLRAFRCEMRLPGGDPGSDWIINECAEGDSVKYEPRLFEYDRLRLGGDPYPSAEDIKDPSADDLEEADRIIRESWQLFQNGLHDRILFYPTAKYRSEGTPDTQ
jgi:hypothetical protein